MAASIQLRPHNRDLGMMVRDVDEDLAIYLGVRNGGEEVVNDHLLNEDLDDSKELGQSKIVKMATDEDLNLETDKGDNDWLLTQPNLSVIPAIETKGQDDPAVTETSSVEATSLKSEQLGKTCEESDSSSKKQTNKRPSSSGSRVRSITPYNTRLSLPAKSRPSRPSTPTSGATLLPASKPTKAVQTRSSTPSKAQVSRPSLAAGSKSSSRSSTPTRKTSLPSSEPDSSSDGPKVVPKSHMALRGSSQMVKSRPSSDILSKSHNASQNPKMSVIKRPVSASRGRPSSINTSSSSNAKLRQKSCSPAKVRVPIATSGNKVGNTSMVSRSRGNGKDSDDVNPVVIGTKMVERVVNMRKLAPPKQDECLYSDKPKKSSKDSSGFGRSLSNKSLDMAIRHMDIRRSIPENLRPVTTSLANDVKPRCAKSDTTLDVSESPLTTSSGSDSSKYSVDSYKSNVYYFLNNGREMDQSSSYEG